MKEYVYYIPLLDEIVVWDFLNGDNLFVTIDATYNTKKYYDIIYLGEL